MDADWFEKIEDYLSGKLSPEEQRQFEATMAANEGRAAAFVTYQAIEQEMHSNEYHKEQEAALKTTLQQLNARYFNANAAPALPEATPLPERVETASATHEPSAESQKHLKHMPAWIRYAVAACLLGFIALGMIWYQKQAPDKAATAGIKKQTPAPSVNPPDTVVQSPAPKNITSKKEIKKKKQPKIDRIKRDALFAKYFKQEVLLLAPMDREGPLEEVFFAYENKKYAEVITAIDNADTSIVTRGEEADQKRTTFYAHYYKALSYMAAGAVAKAVPHLKKALIVSPDSTSKIYVQWYLALAYMKTDDSKKAVTLFNQLTRQSTKSTIYPSKARVLLKEWKGRQ